MKKKLILIPIISIGLIILGCNNVLHIPNAKSQLQTPFVQVYTKVKKGEEGGNPEVKLIHDCLKLNNRLYAQCINKIFPNESNVLVSARQGKPILLAGRGETIEKDQVNLENTDVYLLYVDISNIKLPITSNIINTKTSLDNNTMLFYMSVKEINKKIILKNKNEKIILEYEIIHK